MPRNDCPAHGEDTSAERTPTYIDSECVEQAVSEDGTGVHVGQLWKNRRNKPETVFAVLKVTERRYPDGKVRHRVSGMLSGHNCFQPDRSLDLESLRNMFPVLMFEPQREEPIEDK
jgi:hypothetical protein